MRTALLPPHASSPLSSDSVLRDTCDLKLHCPSWERRSPVIWRRILDYDAKSSRRPQQIRIQLEPAPFTLLMTIRRLPRPVTQFL